MRERERDASREKVWGAHRAAVGIFASLEVQTPQSFLASCDVQNAFYNIKVPEGLAQCFTLPAVTAFDAGVSVLGGERVHPRAVLVPYLRVLPMGWTHALSVWQAVVCGIRLRQPRRLIGRAGRIVLPS